MAGRIAILGGGPNLASAFSFVVGRASSVPEIGIGSVSVTSIISTCAPRQAKPSRAARIVSSTPGSRSASASGGSQPIVMPVIGASQAAR